MADNRRYTLEHRNESGRIVKITCPICGAKKRFAPYWDNLKQQYISGAGKCDRINHCGAHITPAEAVAPGMEQNARQTYYNEIKQQRRAAELQRIISLNYVVQFWAKFPIENNNLYKYLCALFGPRESAEMLHKYVVTDDSTGGAAFWQTDGKGTATTARIIQYYADGHRDKLRLPTWAHSLLQQRQQVPQDYQPIKYLFGLHTIEPNKPVLIVESEKSAILCALYKQRYPSDRLLNKYGAFLATGGATMITTTLFNSAQVLKAANCKIYICPDDDPAGDTWRGKAELLGVEIDDLARQNNPHNVNGWDIGDYIDLLQKMQQARENPTKTINKI